MTRQRKDPYRILGIKPTATSEEIKRAFRRQALALHPDRNRGDEVAARRFSELTEAYDLLSDPDRRRQFDGRLWSLWRQMISGMRAQGEPAAAGQTSTPQPPVTPLKSRPIVERVSPQVKRPEGAPQGAARPQPGQMEPAVEMTVRPFAPGAKASEMGQKRPASPPPPPPETRRPDSGSVAGKAGEAEPQRGEDIFVEVDVPFLTAARGGEHEAQVALDRPCPECAGQGCQPGSRRPGCPDCAGRGRLEGGGVCPRCLGRGFLIEVACSRCGGSGSVTERRSFKVEVPPLMESGHRVRVEGEGEKGKAGGPAGDLVLELNVAPHAQFDRRGTDIYSRRTINLAQAVYGDTIEVETLQGFVELELPPGTSPGSVLRLAGWGVPANGTGGGAPGKGERAAGGGAEETEEPGHHYVLVDVDLPALTTKTAQKRFYSLADACGLIEAMAKPPDDPRKKRSEEKR